MSMSDSAMSSQGGDYRRQLTRDRLLYDMLRSTKAWGLEINMEVLEDINRRRQPLPTMDAIYFIQPTKENVAMFLSDMTGRAPRYQKAFVFFSSPVPRELMDLEDLAIDSQVHCADFTLARLPGQAE
ncbi:hypothetical protein Vadar_019444 [Vaccinium darrowii]|uniref:Uncharacterized protein n=1 Tax=Vaccinium darrowii TaxID=229202 RepID=A0ACB7Y9B7_9ERIC|nr:hypothetical protein Vadar_019444 [Vaccinium darrowii]